jgi:hypothetical protein
VSGYRQSISLPAPTGFDRISFEGAPCLTVGPLEPTTVAEAEQMKAICGPCPFSSPCLDLGRASRSAGVWGGVLLNDRGQPTGTPYSRLTS